MQHAAFTCPFLQTVCVPLKVESLVQLWAETSTVAPSGTGTPPTEHEADEVLVGFAVAASVGRAVVMTVSMIWGYAVAIGVGSALPANVGSFDRSVLSGQLSEGSETDKHTAAP